MAHERCKFYQMLRSKLFQGLIESRLADLVVLEEFVAVVDDRPLIGSHFRQGLSVSDGVDQSIGNTFFAGGRDVGVPNVLTVHGPCGGDDRQFQDPLGELGLVPQITGQMIAPLGHLRAVDGEGTWTSSDRAAGSFS